MPLPHISASLPSALMMRMRASAARTADEQHAVGAEPVRAVADAPRERGRIVERRDALVDEDELVARSVRLHDRDAGVTARPPRSRRGSAARRARRCGEIVETACL